jgi:hypothetical protein
MQNFDITDYFVTCSLNQRTIFIKLVNKLSYICYESNLEENEFRLSFGLEGIYNLITKCFKQQPGATFKIQLNSSNLLEIYFNVQLVIDMSLNNVLDINFDILLREKLMSNDAQLSINYHRIEQKQSNDMKILMDRITQLEAFVDIVSNAEIMLINGQYSECYPVNSVEISLTRNCQYQWNKIQYFPKLIKLIISDNNYLTDGLIKNNNVEVLELNSCGSVTSFDKLNGLPNLKKIILNSCKNCGNLVFALSSYKHLIKTIDITSCSGINNTEIMNYCQKNMIHLELK